MRIVTCIAPVNIAVIKYWGKRDEDLILPLNDSISATLSTDIMCAKTTIMTSPLLKDNRFWLNGKEQSFDNPRLANCLRNIKKRSNQSLPQLEWKISICSKNNFPTAAGLASSAAGYACLVSALAALYEVEGEISDIARQGSGSACRSIYGGWVQWHKGFSETGEDSVARPIAPASHWPEMRVLILVVNDTRKKYSSTSGMKTSAETSTFIKHRAEQIVPARVAAMTEAILDKDFNRFAKITMKDSNQFHAVCMDTFPPCFYMNDTSHSIIDLVHSYNDFKKEHKVGYTFDAGPNACIYLLESEVEEFIRVLNYVFPKASNLKDEEYFRGLPYLDNQTPIQKDSIENMCLNPHESGLLKYIIYTKVGEGPQILTDSNDHLLLENGLPIEVSL